MDAGQVGNAVDKLAEKLGVAVDKIVPIAVETVRQVSNRGLAKAICFAAPCFLATIVCLCYLRHTRSTLTALKGQEGDYERRRDWLRECDVARLCVTCWRVISFVPVMLGCMLAYPGLSQWIAPIPYLLGK